MSAEPARTTEKRVARIETGSQSACARAKGEDEDEEEEEEERVGVHHNAAPNLGAYNTGGCVHLVRVVSGQPVGCFREAHASTMVRHVRDVPAVTRHVPLPKRFVPPFILVEASYSHVRVKSSEGKKKSRDYFSLLRR